MYVFSDGSLVFCLQGQGDITLPLCIHIRSYRALVFRPQGQGDTTLPLCIFGVTGLVAAGLTLPLPETSGQELPITIADAVAFGKYVC